MLAEIVQIKLKAAAAGPGSAGAEKLRTELAEKRMDGANQLVIMKKLNRMDKIRLRSGRDALHKEKLAVDSNHLQLQNLLYEAEHLRKEVQRCFQFKSQDEEIELVPEQQFYDEAPVEIARPEQTRNDEHSRRLARLEWELQQRKQLASMCTELQLQKKLAAKHIDSKTDRLESLAPHLESLLRATRPLQEALSLPVEDTWKVNRVARLLPAPLYMAYENLSAYAEACDMLLVAKINGDESDVLDDIDDDIDVLLDDDSGSAAHNTQESSTDVHDPDDEQMESDGEEQRVRHHHHHHHNHHRREQQQQQQASSNSSAHPASIETGTDEAQLERLLRAHPLSVSFEVRVRSKSAASAAEATLNVTLRYLSALNLVTATCAAGALADEPILSAASLLTALTAGDLGLESPHPKTHYQLRAVRCDAQRFAALLATKKLGRPYRWAQQLCGLDMTSVTDAGAGSGDVVASLEITQASVPQVVRQIRQRWQSRLALCEQIRTLTASIAVRPTATTVPCVAAVLQRWQAIDWAVYSKQAAVQRFVQTPGVIDEHDLFYTVTVGRGTVARFECAVRVSVQHPRTLPLWALSFHGGASDVAAQTAQTNAIVRVSVVLQNCCRYDYCLTKMCFVHLPGNRKLDQLDDGVDLTSWQRAGCAAAARPDQSRHLPGNDRRIECGDTREDVPASVSQPHTFSAVALDSDDGWQCDFHASVVHYIITDSVVIRN